MSYGHVHAISLHVLGFPQAFSIKLSQDEVLNVSSESARDVVHMELTLAEFAEALSMSSTSSFVTKVCHRVLV